MKTLLQVSSLILVFFITACDVREDFELPSWDVEASAPIATSSVTFEDLLGDTTLSIDTLGDKSLVFVYQKDLVQYNFDEIVELNSIAISRLETLGDLDINDVSFSDGTTFGEVVSSISIPLTGGSTITIDDGSLIPIVTPSGSINPFVAERTDVIQKTIEYDASDNFHLINFAQGTLDFTLRNNFDINLTNIIIEIFSTEDDASIIPLNTFNISTLNAGGIYAESIDLASMTMTGNIRVSISNVDIPAQSPTFVVNYEDDLVASVLIKDIKLQDATVILPNQELVNEDTTFVFNVGNGAELKRVKMSDGEIKMDISSSINSVLKYEFSIPKATLNGVPFTAYREVPPGGSINESISLADYEFDLTGQAGNQTNTIYVESYARIDSTGELVSISVEDGVESTISIQNIAPSAAWGFLGQDTVSESRETSFLDLSALKGDIDFEFVEVKMVTENNLGVSADLYVQKIESTSESSTIVLESCLLDNPFTIEPAVESNNSENPVSSVVTEIIFDESNSNIDKIVESKPSSIAFDFEMVVNGDNNQDDGFIYLDYGVSSELQIEIPVSMKGSNMVMKDTVDVSISIPSIIENGSFTILVDNGFPFDADIKMEMMTQSGIALETLESENIVMASEVDLDGKTVASTSSVLRFPFEDLSNVLANTSKIGIEITLNTQPSNQYIKLYSDYSIDMTVIANFEKLISQTIIE